MDFILRDKGQTLNGFILKDKRKTLNWFYIER